MFKIAIVGSAEVIVRAIGNKLQDDIQKALEGASKNAHSSGQKVGDQFGAGVSEGVKKHSSGIGESLASKDSEIGKIGQTTGKKLGNQIGKGVEKSRLRTRLIRSLVKLAVLIPIIGALVGGISTLVSGLFALVAAAGTASAALIVFPGILAAIGQGAIVAAVGFKGVGAAIAAGFDPSKAEKFQKEMAKLPPSAQSFVKEFLKLRDGIKGIRAAASEGLFNGPNGLIKSLKILEPLLPKIAEGFRATGEAIAFGVNAAVERLTSGNALNNFAINAATSNIAIKNLGISFGNLGATVLATLSAAAPIIRDFSAWLAIFTGRLRAASEAGQGNSTLAAYFFEAADVAKIFIDVVKNLFIGLFRLGQVAQPFGLDILNSLNSASKAFANLTNDAARVEGLQGRFANIRDNLFAIGNLAKDLGAAFLRLGSDPGVGKIAEALREAIPNFEELLRVSTDAGPALVGLASNLALLVTGILKLEVLQGVVKILSGFAQILGTIVNFISPVLGPILQTVAVFKIFGIAARLANIAVGILIRSMVGLAGAFFALPLIGQIAAIVTLLAFAFRQAWKHSETFRKIVVGVLKVVISHFQLLLTSLSVLLDSMASLPFVGGKFKAAAEAVRGFSNKLDGAKDKLDGLVKKKVNIKVGADTALARHGLIKLKKDGSNLKLFVKVTADLSEIADQFAALSKSLPRGSDITGISGALGSLSGGIASAIRRQVRARTAESDAFLRGGSGSGSGGGAVSSGGGDDGGDKDKEKEKKEGPLVDLRPVFQAITKDTDTFREALNTFIQNLRENGEWQAVRIAAAFRARMNPFLKELDKVRDKIKQFGERVLEVRNSLIDRANIFAGGGDEGTDFKSITDSLTKARTETLDLATALRQLRGLGLNNTMLQQLADAGPEGLARAASIVREGAAGVARLNKLQGEIAGFAGVAGREAGAAATGAGAISANAFIEGLKKQRATLQAQLDALGRSMGRQIALQLGKDTKSIGLIPKSPAPRVSTTKPAPGPTASGGNSISIQQIFNGPQTGATRNRELDWTLRYASPTSASTGGAGGINPIGVDR